MLFEKVIPTLPLLRRSIILANRLTRVLMLAEDIESLLHMSKSLCACEELVELAAIHV